MKANRAILRFVKELKKLVITDKNSNQTKKGERKKKKLAIFLNDKTLEKCR